VDGDAVPWQTGFSHAPDYFCYTVPKRFHIRGGVLFALPSKHECGGGNGE
jgi:hypothetical protein